ncbi:MAG: enoyl-CoA hydratase/isomerase family protein [Thermodesulfobacteriota bacterium]
MDFQTLTLEEPQSQVARITLNRPEQYNAINRQVTQEMVQVLHELRQSSEIRVLILTGAGHAFCAGGDISWLTESQDVLHKRQIVDRAAVLINSLDAFPKPVVCAVNGVAAGAGTALVLASDIILGAKNAKFAPNFVHIGAVPDSGASWYLLHKLGYHLAAELLLTGNALDSGQAHSLGIFNQVLEPEELQQKALELAGRLAAGPQRAQCSIKRLLKLGMQNSLDSQLETEASLQVAAWSDPDFQEGVQAFMQKRKPNFS